jgi:hypothetical protein
MADQEQSLGKIRKQQKPFIMSPTHICRNNQISSVAYKLWNVIESKPENWEFFWYEILNHFKEGRNKVKKSLKELEKFGFVKKTRRKKGNLYCGMDFELFYDPTLPLIQENQGSARVTENGSIESGSHENRSAENGETEARSTENGNTKKDIIKQDRVSKNNSSLSLEEMENFFTEILRERNFTIDVKKFYDWCVNEGKLKTSWKNIGLKWIEKPENQILKKSAISKTKTTESPEISKLRTSIKFELERAGVREAASFFYNATIEKTDRGFIVTVKNPKALEYQEILAKINVTIEVK